MNSHVFSQLIVSRICDTYRVFASLNVRGNGGQKINRPYHALYLKIEGKTTYQTEDNVYLCDPNHLVFLPKGCSYSVHFDQPGACYLVEFDANYVASDILSVPLNNPSMIINDFARLEKLWLFKAPSYLPKAMAALYGMLAKLDKLINPSYISSEHYHFVAIGLKYLELHYADPNLRIEQMSNAAGISQVHFRRLFKEVYGVSPIQYIRNLRIEKAKSMLAGEFATIEEIAYAVGFTNPYHFCATFREITGQTPKAYARMHG